MSVLLLLILFVLAWVVLILPKQRELKRHNSLVASLDVGDEVMSGSGIYGTITEIDGDIVHLEIAPGTEIRVARRAVAAKVATPEADAEAAEELVDGDVDVEGLPAAGDHPAADDHPDDDADGGAAGDLREGRS